MRYRGHDCAVDCWALGVIIFEMLAGFTPFLAANRNEICEVGLPGNL